MKPKVANFNAKNIVMYEISEITLVSNYKKVYDDAFIFDNKSLTVEKTVKQDSYNDLNNTSQMYKTDECDSEQTTNYQQTSTSTTLHDKFK